MNYFAKSLAFVVSILLTTNLCGGEIAPDELRKACPELFEYIKFSSDITTNMGLEEAPVKWLQKQVASIEEDVVISVVRNDDFGFDLVKSVNGRFNIVVPIEKAAKPEAIHSVAWSRLAYRIFFIEHSNSIQAAWYRFRKGEIGDEKLLDLIERAHFESMKDIKAFFNNVWRPWAIKNGAIPINSRAWFLYADTSDYATWLAQQQKIGNVALWKKWVDAQK